MVDPIPLFVRPNWSTPYTVERSYKTEIFTANKGYEQRRASRITARVVVEFQAVMTGNQRRQFLNFRKTRRTLAVAVPYVPQWFPITVQDGVVQYPAELPRWFYPSDKNFVYDRIGKSHQYLTMAEVPSMADGAYKVYRGVFGTFEGEQSVSQLTSDVLISNITIKIDAGAFDRGYTNDVIAEEAGTYRGYFLLNINHNWSSAVGLSLITPNTLVDFEYGKFKHLYDEDFNYGRFDFVVNGATANVATALENFFDYHRGRQRRFYFDAPIADVEFLTNNGTYGTVDPLTMENGTDLMDRVLVFETGSVVGIKEVITVGASKRVIFDQPAPVGALKAKFRRMARFTSDVMTTDWLTDQVSETKISLTTLPEAFAEIAMGGYRLSIGGDYVTLPEIAELENRVSLDAKILTIGGFVLTISNNSISLGV